MTFTATVHTAQELPKVLEKAGAWCKPWSVAGHRMEVVVRQATRNSSQNAKLHAMLSDISRQVQWVGKVRDPDTWKRLLTAAWLRARGESVEILPAIDGHGVDVVFRRTSNLTVKECAELIEFVQAWAAEQGVRMSAPEWMEA
jgi:NinB protein